MVKSYADGDEELIYRSSVAMNHENYDQRQGKHKWTKGEFLLFLLSSTSKPGWEKAVYYKRQCQALYQAYKTEQMIGQVTAKEFLSQM